MNATSPLRPTCRTAAVLAIVGATLVWWLLSAAAVELIPSFVKFHRPAWALGTENEFQVLNAGIALLAAALAYESVGRNGSKLWRFAKGVLFVCIAFGSMAYLVRRLGAPLSRLAFGISFGVAILLMLLRVAQTRGRLIATGALAVLVLGVGVTGVWRRDQDHGAGRAYDAADGLLPPRYRDLSRHPRHRARRGAWRRSRQPRRCTTAVDGAGARVFDSPEQSNGELLMTALGHPGAGAAGRVPAVVELSQLRAACERTRDRAFR